jgi:hypothetical protein
VTDTRHTKASLRLPAKTAAKNICSEQDDCASGFAWIAREPQLMCGAKGRASLQRSTDYHNPAPHFQRKSHIPQDFHKIYSIDRMDSFTVGARFPLPAAPLL